MMQDFNFIKKIYSFEQEEAVDSSNREFAVLSIDELLESSGLETEEKEFCRKSDFAFYGSGWQSWGFGGETDAGKFQDKYFPVVPQWKQYITFPGKLPRKILGRSSSSKKLLAGCFIIYLRWSMADGKNVYLVLASTGNIKNSSAENGKEENALPPVKFYVDRKSRRISCTVYADGKKWSRGNKIAELTVFSARNFFELKNKISSLFAADKKQRFGNLEFLNSKVSDSEIKTGGWESWYNHYADINHTLISEDLNALGKSENIIKTFFIDKNRPCVFQVDDGWEKGLGQWQADEKRFPEGMTALAASIADKGFIPGLWLAPFIIDLRTDFAKAHSDWILKDKNNKPVQAGFNPLWGDFNGKYQPGLPHSYYCFDLSRQEVVEYLDSLMDKVINEWGFRYLKLDFLFAGMLNGKFAEGGAAYEWYARAVNVLTKRTENSRGQKVAYLGCGMPFEASFNAFPLSRIGPDTKEDWDVNYLRRFHFPARTSAYANMQSTLGHAFWNQSVYINDPDVIFLRYNNITLSDKEKVLIALVNYLFASQLMHSDDPVKFDESKEGAWTRQTKELFEKFENENFGQVNNDSDSYFIFSENGKYAGFINLSDREKAISSVQLIEHSAAENLKNKNAEKVQLKKVIEYAEKNDGKYKFLPHSISIYEVQLEK